LKNEIQSKKKKLFFAEGVGERGVTFGKKGGRKKSIERVAATWEKQMGERSVLVRGTILFDGMGRDQEGFKKRGVGGGKTSGGR